MIPKKEVQDYDGLLLIETSNLSALFDSFVKLFGLTYSGQMRSYLR